jgi:molecular chaperone DnaK
LRQAHQAQDAAGIDTALNALNAAWQAASSEIYQASGGNAAGAGPSADAGGPAGPDSSGTSASEGDVSDVEFEEVKDNKK